MSTPTAETPTPPVAPEAKAADGPTGTIPQPRHTGTRQRRRTAAMLGFVLGVIVPTILGIVYYSFIASDRYAAGASFVVRGLDQNSSADMLSSVTGFNAGGSTTSDSYVVRGYLESADLLRKLDEELDIRAHYSDPEVDLVARYNNDQPFEYFVEYWPWRIDTSYDSTTGIVTYEVQAFDADMSLKIADAVLTHVDRLVNALSETARRDAVYFATAEVERAEEILRRAQLDLREFRTTRGSVDPTMNAQLDAELIADLEGQLSDTRARIAVLSEQVSASAPTLRQLRAKAAALEAQIDERRASVSAQNPDLDGTSTAAALTEYEALQIEQTFAQQRYASALTSLETARMDANRQQRYLAVFSRPAMPEDAVYPRRLRNAILVAIAAFVIWSIASLIITSVRDHLR